MPNVSSSGCDFKFGPNCCSWNLFASLWGNPIMFFWINATMFDRRIFGKSYKTNLLICKLIFHAFESCHVMFSSMRPRKRAWVNCMIQATISLWSWFALKKCAVPPTQRWVVKKSGFKLFCLVEWSTDFMQWESNANGTSCLIIWMTCNVGCTGNAWPAIGHMNCKSQSFVLCVRFLKVTGEFEVIAQLQLSNQIFQKIHKKLKLNAKLIWNSWRCCNATQPNSFDTRFETELKIIAAGDCASKPKLTGIHLVTGHKCLHQRANNKT